MKIRVMTLCKNEEIIIPHFINYYSAFADEIIIIDGHCTDKSLEIAQYLGGEKVFIKRCEYDDGKTVNDETFMHIRNKEWKQNAENFDWVIVCDCDEFVYHPDLYNILRGFKEKGITLPSIEGYQMYGIDLPVSSSLITDQIKKGHRHHSYDKYAIFNPKEISEMNYGVGSHNCAPVGKVVTSTEKLKLLHYRFINYNYVVDKAKVVVSRLSEINLKNNWGYHNRKDAFSYTLEEHTQLYNTAANVV